jgi:hypothetical protein
MERMQGYFTIDCSLRSTDTPSSLQTWLRTRQPSYHYGDIACTATADLSTQQTMYACLVRHLVLVRVAGLDPVAAQGKRGADNHSRREAQAALPSPVGCNSNLWKQTISYLCTSQCEPP